MLRISLVSLIFVLHAAQAAHTNLATERTPWTIGQSVNTSSSIFVGQRQMPQKSPNTLEFFMPTQLPATFDLLRQWPTRAVMPSMLPVLYGTLYVRGVSNAQDCRVMHVLSSNVHQAPREVAASRLVST